MTSERRYRHFCPMARALERVGERWALLVVRDLLPGPQRFTDLLSSCGGITPRQLAARLRQLEGDGIVEREETPGRREVWYRLTEAGAALRPAVEGLLLWGVEHAGRPPAPQEPVSPYHVLNGTRLALAERARAPGGAGLPARALSWVWRFPEGAWTLRFDGQTWTLDPGEASQADVVVETTPRAWATLVMSSGDERAPQSDALRLHGPPRRLQAFRAVFGLSA
ncbi:MAG TPA: winged helix-turn-helix transcriptional regulator [Chloroflexota bacterium]|nr:winged helix-turn-helix transcriptional regulator [Chloroflexota bacterium]